VMTLDGIDLHGSTNIVGLGMTTEGEKLALRLWEGSSENAAVASALLADLVDRGLDIEQGLLFVIDGSKSAPQSRPPSVRPRGPGLALRAAQRTQRTRSPPRTRPRHGQAATASSVAGDRPQHRAGAAHRASSRARPPRPRRRRLPQRRHGRDPHRNPTRDQGQASTHPAIHQPLRVRELHRPRDQPQRQELELRRDVPTLDRRRNPRSPKPASAKSRATAGSHNSPSRSNTTSQHQSPSQVTTRRAQTGSARRLQTLGRPCLTAGVGGAAVSERDAWLVVSREFDDLHDRRPRFRDGRAQALERLGLLRVVHSTTLKPPLQGARTHARRGHRRGERVGRVRVSALR
jgi:hypothetical protein